MKYKVIKNGKRIVPNDLGADMVILKHTHNRVVYVNKIEWINAKRNHTVNRQIVHRRAEKLRNQRTPKLTKQERKILIKDTIQAFLMYAKDFDNTNKIISSYMFGEIVKDIKSQNDLGLLLYGHFSEEHFKGLLQEISLLV